MLTAGFLGQKALNPDQSVQLKWSEVTLEFYRNQLAISGNPADLYLETCEMLVCNRAPISGDAVIMDAVIGDVAVDDAMWEKLGVYAHITYVEASEASRLAGAGAGINDND